MVEVLSDGGSEQGLVSTSFTSSYEEGEEEKEESTSRENGNDSNDEFEESEDGPFDRATLKEIFAKVSIPSSAFFRQLSLAAKRKRMFDPPTSSPIHDQSLLKFFSNDQPTSS